MEVRKSKCVHADDDHNEDTGSKRIQIIFRDIQKQRKICRDAIQNQQQGKGRLKSAVGSANLFRTKKVATDSATLSGASSWTA